MPSAENLKKIANYLDITMEELLQDEEAKEENDECKNN